jgi:hypothetical protein
MWRLTHYNDISRSQGQAENNDDDDDDDDDDNDEDDDDDDNNNNNNNNKPDIIIRDNEKWTCVLIDVSVPGDRNVIKKEAESLNYKDLNNRNTAHVEFTQRKWNQ